MQPFPKQGMFKSYVTEVDRKGRSTVGLVSTDGQDRDQDVLDQESMGKAMELFVERSGIVVYMHDWGGGVGRVTDMSRTKLSGGKTGTLVKVRYGEGYSIPTKWGTLAVDDVWAQVEQGILRTHSHAFNAVPEDPELMQVGASKDKTPRRLLVTDVFEVSLVTVPANADAVFEVTKALASEAGHGSLDTVLAEARRLVEELRGLRDEHAALAAIVEARRALRG